MRKFIISDIHGFGNVYYSLMSYLDNISEHEEIELYINGDLIDRGYESAEILLDVKKRIVENKFKTLSIPSCVYGHISCSHLHCDMFYKNDEEKLIAEKIYSDIIDYGLTIGGTVSAEHGIGKIKREFFYRMYTSEQIDKMKKIKSIFDKKNILDVTNLFY